MQKTKILLCFGTRPEAIKIALLYDELKKSDFNPKNENPYGDGKASEKIAHFLQKISQ